MSFLCSPISSADIEKKLQANKDASLAGIFAGTGIPLLDTIIKDLSGAITGLAATGIGLLGSAGAANASGIAASLSTSVGPLVANALTSIVAILNVGAEAQIAMYGFMFDALKRQVRLRNILLREIQFHTEGVIGILNRTNRGVTQPFDTTLRRALPYIQAAYKDVDTVRKSMLLPKPRFNMNLLRRAIYNIDCAIGILTGDTSRAAGAKFFKDVKKKGVGGAFKDFIFESMLSEYILLAETYIWHLTNMTSVIIGGGAGYGMVDLTGKFGSSLPGIPDNRESLLKQRQRQLEGLKAELYRNMPKETTLQALAWLDTNKGFILTHEAVKVSVAAVQTADVNWDTLAGSAKALWVSLSPAHGILKDIKEKVENNVKTNASGKGATGFTKIVAEPLLFGTWITAGLEGVKQLLLMQEKAGAGFEAVAADLAIIEKILAYLQSPSYKKNSEEGLDTLLKMAATVGSYAVTAPFNSGIMRRALVLFTEMRILSDKALVEETQLLSLLGQLSIMDNPLTAGITNALSGVAAQSPFGAALVGGLVSGQWATISGMLTSVVATVAGGVGLVKDLLKSITGGCDKAKDKPALSNAKSDAEAKLGAALLTKTASAKEYVVVQPKGPWCTQNPDDYYASLPR